MTETDPAFRAEIDRWHPISSPEGQAILNQLTEAGGDGQPCEDCGYWLPWDADCYAIDCGNVVCLCCGMNRGLSDDYRYPH